GAHVNEEDFLLLELLDWFKTSFFHWVNSLPCSRCGGQTEPKSDYLLPTDDDLRWDASRVENHYCNRCQLCNRFPSNFSTRPEILKNIMCFLLCGLVLNTCLACKIRGNFWLLYFLPLVLEVVDVTWRYSCKHEEVLSRRTALSEATLRETINALNR
ncbi:NGLY1 amidase, partial [Erpornis zantholeuca]|nr:NGLY1 amidase [Erpornis zantholeuca]